MGKKDKIKKGTGKPKAFRVQDSIMTRLGLGFDPVLDTIDSVESAYTLDSLSKIPPFNIKKITDIDYVIEVSLAGVKRDDINAVLDEDYLTISASLQVAADPEGDDIFLHRGIFQGGTFEAKFVIARNLQHNYSEFVDGILYVYFVDKNIKRVATRLAIGPFPKPDTTYVVDYDSSGSPIMVPVGSTVASADAVPLTPTEPAPEATAPVASDEEVYVPAEEPAPVEEISIIVDSNNPETPTTEVVLPVELPQIVEVVVPTLPEAVDSASPEPQVTLEVKDATYEVVSDDVVTEVIHTPEGSADIVVAIPTEAHESLTEAGIDPVAAIETAIEASTAPAAGVVELPAESVEVKEPEIVTVVTDNLSVEVPVELPAVVVMEELPSSTEETPAVTLDVTSETALPNDAVFVPVVTPEGQNDIVVAVPAELHETLTEAGVDVGTEVGNALAEAAVEVVTTETEVVTEILNSESTSEPTIEVVLPVELPQIVEVTAELPTTIDTTNPEPQVVLTVEDATHEVVADNVVTEILHTEEGKADVVVAVPTEVHESLTEAGIDVVEVLEAAIEQSEVVTLPELPVIPEETTTDTVVVETPTAEELPVVIPDAIPSVVEVTVEDDKVVLIDSSASIPDEATVAPVVTADGNHDVVVVVTPETAAVLEEKGLETPEAVIEIVTEALVTSDPDIVPAGDAAPADAATVDTVTAVFNDENTEVPTVEVTVPEVLPQIVEVKLEEVAPAVETASEEPQVAITLEDATHEIVADSAELIVVPTEEGKADLIVAVPEEVKAAVEEAGVSVEEVILPAIEEAVKAEIVEAPVLVEAPVEPETKTVEVTEAVEVIVPTEVTPVMEVSVAVSDDAATTLELKPTDESVSVEAELVPVVTPEGQNDIVVVVPEEVKELFAETDVTVEEALTTAVADAEVTVTEVPTTSEEVIAEEKSDLQ